MAPHHVPPGTPGLGGEVEIDETFIGGKVRDTHKERKMCVQKHSQKGDKTIVMGFSNAPAKDADGEVISDADRFSRLWAKVVGKRLTYAELTAKVGQK